MSKKNQVVLSIERDKSNTRIVLRSLQDTWIKGKEKVKPRGRLVPSRPCLSMKVCRQVAM